MKQNFKIKDPIENYKKQIEELIIEVDKKLVCNHRLFNIVDDESLIESLIYERKSLCARRSHLLTLYKTADKADLEFDVENLIAQLLSA